MTTHHITIPATTPHCLIIAAALILMLASCTSRPAIPASYVETIQPARIYPACDSVVVPPNIAPLNFTYQGQADDVVARLGTLVATTDGMDLDFDIDDWHALLAANHGQTLPLDIWTLHGNQWHHHPTQHITVAHEPIDSFLVYRLIEPGYELYRQLGIYERDLTTFDERAVVENNRQYDTLHNHCLNCHNFQAYDTRRFLFHIRAQHGGTVIRDANRRPDIYKVDMRNDSILGAGVYPSWHPTLNLVALSTNMTGQMFHMYHHERIEVLDYASDLILYNPETGTVSNILRTDDALETFPCWSPDGTRLYYCSAPRPKLPADLPDSLTASYIAARYDSLIYSIYSIPTSTAATKTGAASPAASTIFPTTEPRLEVADGSCSVPRISPDGRYMLYTRGQYGQFHIWHPTADLWVKDLQRDTCYALTDANSPDADSYHTWSSNGRWIAFATRRDDGAYTRVYITYFDSRGHAHRPFLLPQRRALHNTLLLKSYNVPELVRHRIPHTQSEMQEAVQTLTPQKARYQD